MKKLIAAILAATVIACPFASAAAADTGAAVSDKRFMAGGIVPSGAKAPDEPYVISNDAELSLPEAYNSVEMGYVTPPKDQGSRNTCSLFSAIGAMESALLKNGYGEYDLSEEYQNYWAATRNDGKGWLRDYKIDGAMVTTGYTSLSYGGVIADSDLPYMSAEKANFEELGSYDPLFYAGAIELIPDTEQDKIKKSIMECGAVASVFTVVTAYLNEENNSYCCNDVLPADTLNSAGHGIIVVGWDDNYPKSNFLEAHRPQHDGAWLIKNSWGDEYDYIWISYEDNYFASNYYGGSYGIKSIIKNHTCNSLLNIDQFGPTYNMSLDVDDPSDITFMNVFDFSKSMPVISNVEFQTGCVGAEYEIYYIPVSDGVPVGDRDKWTTLASGKIEYDGIQSISVDDFRVPDLCGAVGIRINSTDTAALGCCEWVTRQNEFYCFIPRTADDRSFFTSGNGGISSLTEYYASMDDSIGGNFSINLVMNVRKGDADKDGSLSLADAIMLQKDIVKILTLDSDVREYVADMDGNGKITVADAIIVQKIIVNILSD